MLLTVTWPANRPSTSPANGNVAPWRACFESRRTSCLKLVGRASPPGGTVASHGTSHAALRCRARRHASWSVTDRGRSVTSRSTSRTGQSVVTARHLFDRVHQHVLQDGDGILHTTARAGQVDDEAAADAAGQAAGEHRG